MDEAAVRTRLEHMLQWQEEPALTEGEVDDLLELAKRPDSIGRLPSEDGWEATWNLNAAAAEGWRWKAGKAAPRFDADLGDGVRFRRAQMYAHCMEQSRRYAGTLVGAISVAPETP